MKAEWGDKAKAVSLIYDFNYDNFGIAKYKTQDIFSKVSELMENDRLKVANDFKSFGEKPAGYEFVGWYFDKACSKPVGEMLQLDSKDKDKENRIYAGWRKIKAENPSNSPN